MPKFYRDYADYLAERFQWKMQKLTVDAGFTCPNRDGTKGWGGCIYCNNATFSPAISEKTETIASQLENGKRFFARKYPDMHFLAYFQSYTNTHGRDLADLISLYEEALSVERVEGIIIGTRPDCMPDGLLSKLSMLNKTGKRVMVEYGAESSHDITLSRVNRCHTWGDTVDAVTRTHEAGIDVGLHLILGLPGESREMMLETVDKVSSLPVDTVKFHQLQIVEHTPLAHLYREGQADVRLFSVEDYAALCCEIVRRLRHDIAIERFTSQSPDGLLIAPRWGLKNYQFVNLLNHLLEKAQG